MIDFIVSLKKGNANLELLEDILTHPDYAMEFNRYKESVTKEGFKSFLLEFPHLKEDEIDNIHLKRHHPFFMDLYHTPEQYKKMLFLIDIPKEVLLDQAEIAKDGLSETLTIDDVHLVFSIGIGASFGYVYQQHVHFDFLQLVKEKTKEELEASIAHEVHHVGFNNLIEPSIMKKLDLEELFYLYLSGEGLAVKYCNTAEGYLSKSINKGPKNVGLDAYSW